MSNTSVDELLARKAEAVDEIVDVDEPLVKLVIFALDERFFAFKGEFIKEVIPASEPLFFVPGMPASLQGVINLRGDIESVILLQGLLQLTGGSESSGGSILLGEAAGIRTGIRVDRLLDVVDLPESLLQATPESLPEALQPYVDALFEFQGKAVTLLDLEKVLDAYQQGWG
ncbi:chemotaxis protein CheW [Marinospirillum perlucidum]|uniref:chemotaxis protein CheW n=1 Tax=Marinospirillum perlucidum TaxID=1982602 RepID=UPI00139041CE|nr:chemotaxis protein CheW [Marinospirillum perlucidum]